MKHLILILGAIILLFVVVWFFMTRESKIEEETPRDGYRTSRDFAENRKKHKEKTEDSSASSFDDLGGWYKLTTTCGQFGMGAWNPVTAEATQQRNDSFIFVDTSVYPINVFSTYFNDEFPQMTGDFNNPALIPLAPEGGATNVLQFITNGTDTTELISPWNAPLSGAVDPLRAYSHGATIKIKDGKLYCFAILNNGYGSTINAPSIFEKIKQEPKDTGFLNWNDPLQLFHFMVAELRYHNTTANLSTKANNYVGRAREDEILAAMKSPEGFTVRGGIHAMDVTNTLNYADVGISNDRLTTLYTGDAKTQHTHFVPIVPGATVKISGAPTNLSILNGTFVNGISSMYNGGDKTLDPRFMDIGPGGSMRDYFNAFCLNLDSTSLTPLADAIGKIRLPPGVEVSATYKISAHSEYPEMMAAIRAFFYLVWQTSTHVALNTFGPPGSSIMYPTTAALRAGFLAGTAQSAIGDIGPQLSYPALNSYYHNWFDFPLPQENVINTPFALTSSNPLLQYDVALGNYLVGVKNLIFAIQGTLDPDQPDPQATFGYEAVIPGPGRAHFVSQLINADTTTQAGLITPGILPAGYQSLGDWGSDYGNFNNYYVGQINPLLTPGQIIGLLRLEDSGFTDQFGLMTTGVYAPENPNTSTNPRIQRESLCEVYAPIFQYLNSLGCQSIIVLWVNNFGGSAKVSFTLAEFCGSQRIAYHNFTVPKNPHEKIIRQTDNKHLPLVNDIFVKQIASTQTMYPELNETKYPGSSFVGSAAVPKFVAFVTDYTAISAGDVAPNYFTGDEDDGNLGSHTFARVFGNVNGKEFILHAGPYNPPLNKNSAFATENLVNSLNQQQSPFLYNRDDMSGVLGYGKREISSSRQHNGLIPLPTPIRGTATDYSNAMPFSLATTILPDFGLIPPIRPPIPGWTSLHPNYPPVFTDPTSRQYTYLDATLLSLSNAATNFHAADFQALKRDERDLSLVD